MEGYRPGFPLRCERAFYFDANRTSLLYASEGKFDHDQI